MSLLAFISITFILFSTTKALSFDFVATAAPSGYSYGDGTVHAMCDPTRVCKQGTRSRTQCQRWNCCWIGNKCCEKKHFIIKPDEPKGVEYQYEASNVEMLFDAARSFCQDKGMDLPQMNPKLYTIAGRREIADSIKLGFGLYWLGIKRYDGNNASNMRFKRVLDDQLVQLDGWLDPTRLTGSTNFVYWALLHHSFIDNTEERSSFFYCEKVISS